MQTKTRFSMSQYLLSLLLFAFIIFDCNTTSQQSQNMETLQSIVVDKQLDWGGNFKLHIQSKTANDSSYIY
jgi:hypothetical protein